MITHTKEEDERDRRAEARRRDDALETINRASAHFVVTDAGELTVHHDDAVVARKFLSTDFLEKVARLLPHIPDPRQTALDMEPGPE